ncbi:DNA primase [Candidatus Formimonas warabiya]|uniref:DNA primase n=1 Tax=Formimonas warabiya TaxID=1761012 RepID=A0A3G1KZ51_FORW1|nr:DNA primase [Candidatus Formimonas warabiya]ATW27657.1 DNA primase [Candidatus Formimonas warabiya]
MSFVPPEIIDEIRTKTDIVEIISEYVSLKRQGKNYVGLCPFHLEDTPSFSVSPDKQIFYCFGCHKGGSVINFIMEQENLTLPEAAEKLADKVGVVIPSGHVSEQEFTRQSQKRRLIEMHELAAHFFHQRLNNPLEGKPARDYLDKRGITRDVMGSFQLGYAPKSWDSLVKHLLQKGFTETEMEKAGLAARSSKGTFYDKFRDRLMFPIWDFRGKVIAFGGRVMGDELPKYLNSSETPIFNKSQNLYGLNIAAAWIRQQDEAVIMEGYMDVIAAHQFGIKNAVASLGTSFTTDQGKLLKRYSSNVLIAYDADTAGAKATSRGLDILQNIGFRVRVLQLPNGLDPDEFLHKYNYMAWVQLAQNKALSLLEYKLQAATAKYNIKSIEGKADVVKELLPDLAKIKSQVEKDQYVKLLARTLGISEDTIYADLRRITGNIEKTDNFNIVKHTNNTQVQVRNVFPENRRHASAIAERNLCRLMIEDRKIFDQVEHALGLDFPEEARLTEILHAVKQMSGEFDWLPATLIERLEVSPLKQFLSQLFMEDYPGDNKDVFVRDYIKTIKLHRMKKRIQEIHNMIQSQDQQSMTGETMQLLQEYTMLQQQVQQLKR